MSSQLPEPSRSLADQRIDEAIRLIRLASGKKKGGINAEMPADVRELIEKVWSDPAWVRRNEVAAKGGKVPPMPWSHASEALLGRMPDKDLGMFLGLSYTSVGKRRMSLGIPSFGPNSERLVWTDEMIALLGKVSDKEICRRYGMTPPAVKYKRDALGIAPMHVFAQPIVWIKKMTDELGTMSDVDFAKKWKIPNPHYVTKKRLRLKIPAWYPEWIEPSHQALLGQHSDGVVAQMTGLSFDAVGYWRRKLGIPAWHAQFNEPKPKAKGPDAPRKIAIPKVEWTPDMLALLGTATDAVIGKRLGLARELVRNERHKYGVPAWYSKKLQVPEDAKGDS